MFTDLLYNDIIAKLKISIVAFVLGVKEYSFKFDR